MLETMITTSTTTASHTPTRRRVAATAASLAVVGALLGMAACSSDDDGSRQQPRRSPRRARRQTRTPTPAPPTSPDPAPPTTAAPPPTSRRHRRPRHRRRPHPRRPWQSIRRARRSWRPSSPSTRPRVSSSAPASRVRDADGTITEASGGTPTLDPASGPVDPDVPWNIGSATKTFVATVVLQLADEGRIDLDAGIDRYVPYLPGADRITPRQLLNHTSGLGEYLDQPATSGRAQAPVDAGRAGRHRRSGRTVRRAGRTAPLLEHQLHRPGQTSSSRSPAGPGSTRCRTGSPGRWA